MLDVAMDPDHTSKVEVKDGRKRCESGSGLHRQYLERLSRETRKPPDPKERGNRHLCNHEQLKGAGGRPLIGLTDRAMHDNMTDHHHE